jgi:hypothetical protein
MGMSTVNGAPTRLTTTDSTSIRRIGVVSWTNLNPSRILDKAERPAGFFRSSSMRINRSPPMTPRYVAPLIAKHQPSPRAATRNPAMTGATELALLKADELRATALSRSSASTIVATRAWRAGTSTALTMPCRAARSRICQSWTCPVSASAARTNANSIETVWVATTTHRRG